MDETFKASLGTGWSRIVRMLVAAAACAAPAIAWGSTPQVVVTVKPVHALVAAVMEGAGSPHLLIDGAGSPHTYALKPSDVRRLAAADVIIRVSAQLEVFLAKPLAQAGERTRVVTLDQIPGMTIHALRSNADFEVHQHVHEAKTPERGHRHGEEGHRHGGVTSATDGHLWLDPANARIATLHIAEVLSAVAPSDASRFRQNAEALTARLAALDQQLAVELKPLSGRPFIVFHDSYQYLERRYGLTGAGAVTINPEVPPSALRISQLRSRLAKDGVMCVFAEPEFPPRAIDTIIEGTSVRRATLDPLGAALPPGPAQYFELMDGLVRDLRGCLAQAE
jgi:zinc transport system substrate-binding protein